MTVAASEKLTLTVDEAAAMLSISRSTAFAAVARGEIPSIRIGRRIVIPRARLEQMLAGEDSTTGVAA